MCEKEREREKGSDLGSRKRERESERGKVDIYREQVIDIELGVLMNWVTASCVYLRIARCVSVVLRRSNCELAFTSTGRYKL